MALIQKDLGSDVFGGTAYGECTFCYDLSEAEINHFQISVLTHHDILGFQIAVHDIFCVQVFEYGDYL